MINRASGFIGHKVLTKDGAICSIQDVCFDDQSWSLRYFVLESDSWSSKQRALLSLEAISKFDDNFGDFTVNVTEEQIKTSPGFGTEFNVSRHVEEQLSQHYGWSSYWLKPDSTYHRAGTPMFPPRAGGMSEGTTALPLSDTLATNIHLRSLSEVKGYALHATDGNIGSLQDFLINMRDLDQVRIIYLIVDSHKWLPGGMVLIDRAMVEGVSWNEQKVLVNMTKDEVKAAPAYDRNMMLTEECLTQFSSYYQQLDRQKMLQGMPPQGSGAGHPPLA